MSKQKHTLIKSSTGWWCQTCHLNWKRKPTGNCIGLPVRFSLDISKEVTWHSAHLVNRRITKDEPIAYYLGDSRLFSRNKNGSPIYLLASQTEIKEPSLPPAYYWYQLKHLVSATELRKQKRQPKAGVDPVACAMNFNGDWIDFYRLEDTEDGEGLQYLTKSRLKDTYYLSKSWLKKLGDPDLFLPNPHHKKFAPMQLYLVRRVEDFLKEHAEEYANWLEKRDKLVANSKHLLDYCQRRQDQQQKVKQQHRMCLRCACSTVFEQGMICAVHPLGLPPGVPEQFFCQDFTEPSVPLPEKI